MLRRSTIQLLRFHFSFFLLPVYLFALSQVTTIHLQNAVLCFCILHLLVYPSSNGYNSYIDRDETPIGGLASPLQPTKQLFYITIMLDVFAVALSFLISGVFAGGILLYILISRAYSSREIRLKKYPVLGFITVFLFQGALVFLLSFYAVNGDTLNQWPWLAAVISSCLIGALYPLTQIYQHEADRKDGVITVSALLGKRGSFVFSLLLFLLATAGLYLLYEQQHALNFFSSFLLYLLPVVLFFLYWMQQVWKNEAKADFKNSLRMNVLSAICTSAYFISIIIQKL